MKEKCHGVELFEVDNLWDNREEMVRFLKALLTPIGVEVHSAEDDVRESYLIGVRLAIPSEQDSAKEETSAAVHPANPETPTE